MNHNIPPSFSRVTNIALNSLGVMIKNCRIERGIPQQDLANRINVSRYTIMAIEKGDPKVAIGVVFEAAYIVGIPLLASDVEGIKRLSLNLANLTSILPKRANNKKRVADAD